MLGTRRTATLAIIKRAQNGHRVGKSAETGAAVDPKCLILWWAQKDSNLQPKDYESSALTVEL